MACVRGGFVKALRETLIQQSTDQTPLQAILKALIQLISSYETKEAIVVDGLFESTEALRARMRAAYIEMEQSAFGALCELWPQTKRPASLRIVAMVSIGAPRVAKEAWRRDGGKPPLAKYLRESFATLEKEI